MKNVKFLFLACFALYSYTIIAAGRKEISLNGSWKIAKTGLLIKIPSEFKSVVPIPGLVDMAQPPIDNQDTAYNDAIYWYKTIFRIESANSDVVLLKINKAMYHTWVFLNGKLIGENIYSFTPSFFDLKPYLKNNSKENELIIAVGCMNNLPDTISNGNDFEKIKYTPGIYDDVKIILSNYPFLKNIQVVPDIVNQQLRIVVEIEAGENNSSDKLTYIIREKYSKNEIAKGIFKFQKNKDSITAADFTVSMKNCSLWSPENPFLYELELSTAKDNYTTGFGMRSFSFSKDSSVAILNGKPYYMRGTNVCIFRFFEDSLRNGLPWDEKWVTKLHQKFKDMNWNCIRYCIGFPPESWYDVADSLGILIQDEFPIWTGPKDNSDKVFKTLSPENIAIEYRLWMRERWNHPCIVIWDAQNESVTENTGAAIKLVRYLDLSNRPWDNGWSPPGEETDCIEAHPYLFIRYFYKGQVSDNGPLIDLLTIDREPGLSPNDRYPNLKGTHFDNAVVANEYCWLWVNRDGSSTELTDVIYNKIFKNIDTPGKRFECYAKNLGIVTEYWRAHRRCAAVMHFCGLGYSRPNTPRGQTSDNFINIETLEFEKNFVKYVKPAFSTVGIFLNKFTNVYLPGEETIIPVYVFNDSNEPWSDHVMLYLTQDEQVIDLQEQSCDVKGLERKIMYRKITMPTEKGEYKLVGEIKFKNEIIKSIREFKIE